MSLPQSIIARDPGLGPWNIMTCYRGSIAHGMYVPSSDPASIDDKDVMAVCVPSRDYYYGLREYGSRGTREIKCGEWDIVIYEARKMVRMLAKGNPNVLMCLWMPSQFVIKTTPAWGVVQKNRDVFVGRHVYHSFNGYAHGQLHRMTHYKFEGYMGEKRKRLVERIGYDSKNAAHLIRLLRMGNEFLKDGVLHVLRPDRQQLLEIKRGEWSLAEVRNEAARLFKLSDELYARCELPQKPDMDRVNEICVEMVKTAISARLA